MGAVQSSPLWSDRRNDSFGDKVCERVCEGVCEGELLVSVEPVYYKYVCVYGPLCAVACRVVKW